jgi:hypothetical protein
LSTKYLIWVTALERRYASSTATRQQAKNALSVIVGSLKILLLTLLCSSPLRIFLYSISTLI